MANFPSQIQFYLTLLNKNFPLVEKIFYNHLAFSASLFLWQSKCHFFLVPISKSLMRFLARLCYCRRLYDGKVIKQITVIKKETMEKNGLTFRKLFYFLYVLFSLLIHMTFFDCILMMSFSVLSRKQIVPD